MPRSATIYRVFVASPSDVSEEREEVKQVINRVNKQLARSHNIQLEYVGWDTDTAPAIGADAQDAINQQINDNYDIFLGILGAKFGTPTKRAQSGTAEEFTRALENFQRGRCLKVMVYFRHSAIEMDHDALDEAKRVVEFRKELENKGALYGQFESTTDFSHKLQMHLYDVATGLGTLLEGSEQDKGTNAVQAQSNDISDEPETPDDDGVFDLLETSEEYFWRVTDITGKMSENVERFNQAINKRTTEAQLLGANKDASNKQRRNFADSSASDFEIFTREMESLVPELQDNYETAINSIIRALQIAEEDDMVREEERKAALAMLQEQYMVLNNTRLNIQEFKETIGTLPRLTRRFNRARRSAADILEILTSFFYVSEQTLQEVIDRYSRE
jgi:hypothetical protein